MNGLIQTLITDSYLCTASFCVGPKYLTVSAHTKKQSFDVLHARAAYVVTTRSSAIAEEPRDASCQLKYIANYHATVQKLLIRQVLTKSMV